MHDTLFERAVRRMLFRELLPLAEQGDAAAQYNLGIMCASGGDIGYAAATDGENLKPVWLDHGEYKFSNEARRG